MKHIYLERHDPDKNLHRFYQFFITPGIFGDWSLVKECGRVGSPGTEAQITGQKLCAAKEKKGYQSIL
ncbi:WGR domain-containing protein [Methylobacter psychrophilus]|uniref:WGR domain-containing protein n=1 Tax=Methylobacter psychrophilus TaxID=96941 RepID=UPI0021D4EFB2|nr:WGR domain-containing protein [Methylobacter psychrophilus]